MATEVDGAENQTRTSFRHGRLWGRGPIWSDQDGDGYEDPRFRKTPVRHRKPRWTTIWTMMMPIRIFIQTPGSCATDEDDNCDGTNNAVDAEGCNAFYLDEDGDGYELRRILNVFTNRGKPVVLNRWVIVMMPAGCEPGSRRDLQQRRRWGCDTGPSDRAHGRFGCIGCGRGSSRTTRVTC